MNPTRRILIVDDSRTALMMNEMILKRAKCEVATAKDGREAVQRAVEFRPDLILMDIMMPNMNGFEAVRAIRATPGLAEVPIIMVTTRGEAENAERGYTCGANEYITKPVDPAELLAKIDDLLSCARQSRE